MQQQPLDLYGDRPFEETSAAIRRDLEAEKRARCAELLYVAGQIAAGLFASNEVACGMTNDEIINEAVALAAKLKRRVRDHVDTIYG